MYGTRNKRARRGFFKRKGFWLFCLLCLIAVGFAARYGDRKLNPYREIAMEYNLERVGEKEEMSFIHDRGGVEIGTMFVENRFSLPLEEIPPVFVDAVLAQEDQRFYDHDGVDWVGVARAAWLNFQSGSITQGAGTITMQLARKSFDLLGEKRRREWTGYERKVVEAFVALRIEEAFPEEIGVRISLRSSGPQEGGEGRYSRDVFKSRAIWFRILRSAFRLAWILRQGTRGPYYFRVGFNRGLSEESTADFAAQ